jgi:hypothetical protein
MLGLDQAPRHREAHVAEADKSNVHDVILRMLGAVLILRRLQRGRLEG